MVQAYAAGLKPQEFYESEFTEVILTIKGYNKRNKESLYKVRRICWEIYQGAMYEKHQSNMFKWFPIDEQDDEENEGESVEYLESIYQNAQGWLKQIDNVKN